jgi:hypothetical protein
MKVTIWLKGLAEPIELNNCSANYNYEDLAVLTKSEGRILIPKDNILYIREGFDE